MSKVVFILGAGASQQGGAPLMANFLSTAKDLLAAGAAGDAAADFARVFKVINGMQVVHSKAHLDLTNIESVFTALELGETIGRVPDVAPGQIPLAIQALKRLIAKTIELKLEYCAGPGSALEAPRPYGLFAELVRSLHGNTAPQYSTSVITFNYDIAVDWALLRVGLGPNYRIDPDGQAEAVDLLKLHGSLHWAVEESGKALRPVNLRDFTSRFAVRPHTHGRRTVLVEISGRLQAYFRSHPTHAADVEAHPAIVPPCWNKSDYHRAFSRIWSAAAEHLSQAEYVYILGYSLPDTDAFFRHLFALGSVGPAFRNLVVYNPSKAVDERFRTLLGPGALAAYRFEPMNFEHAINDVSMSLLNRLPQYDF